MHEHATVEKSEKERATDTITELAPGVLRSQLPIDMPGLGHVNCYILEDERGVALVDPGLPEVASYEAIKGRLADAGIPLKRVHTVIVTHSHPDHFGGARWLRDETGADVVSHRWFQVAWDPSGSPDVDVEDVATLHAEEEAALADAPERRRFRPWDAPPWGGEAQPNQFESADPEARKRFAEFVRFARPTVRLDDAQTIRLAGREWIAVHTPGHTDDHLCLFDPTEHLMISGDHVLPTITPHIAGVARAVDPLAQFFDSLDKVAEFGPQVRLVLPAHGRPFEDLAGRAKAIKEHHEGRLERLRVALGESDRPATVPEMSKFLFSERAQGRMADSETFAHLEHLRQLGQMERHDDADGYFRYVLV
jgi:glyoxylase-like metal-dependent hydrolase (beta-lactamase superfamily II)